ncbi:hypothetical protein YC2023_073079 [Brassica napus]
MIVVILRTVAREHPTDADEAAAVVISEVVPLFPQEWEVHVPKRKLHHLPLCKVEPETQHEDALSQWLHPSHLPQSYLALLNEEEEEEEKSTPDLKPLLDYAVKKVVLPSRDAAAGARREVRTIYSASNNTASSVVKPSIRVQSQTNNEQLSGSSSKVPVAGRSSRKAAHPWSNYSEVIKFIALLNDFSQLHGQCKYVPSWQSNQSNCKSYTTERERKQRIDDNIKALAKLLPHEVKEDSSEVILNEIVDHVKLLQLEMKELSLNRLGGEPISHPMTFIEGFGHYIHHEEMMTKPLEEMMEDLLANDPDAAARLLESKGLYLMPLSSVQDLC